MLKLLPASVSKSFVEAARHTGQVSGHTHVLYKYPARFSPVFARSAIQAFTEPGQTVLDPFVGGGTTMVEARLAGRHAFASDISTLAVFLTKAKVVPLSEADLRVVERWFESVSQGLNIHRAVEDSCIGDFAGYDRNMPWRLRKLCEQYIHSVSYLPRLHQQRFARCILLRCGQWAMDCRKEIPTADEFRSTLAVTFVQFVEAMREYRRSLRSIERNNCVEPVFRCIKAPAANLTSRSFGKAFASPANLVLTSPPYPGVHVLYHRWNVRGRRETPAPFWLADCQDGHGSVHYTLGDRKQERLKGYFDGIQKAFRGIRNLLADHGLVVQVVAFSKPEWQLDAYLQSMQIAGFVEIRPEELGIAIHGRLWRAVPGRRWYSAMRGDIPSSNEVVLFHRKAVAS